MVAERRGEPLEGINLTTSIANDFTWLPGAPLAGKTARLAYNKSHGPLRWLTSPAHWTALAPSIPKINHPCAAVDLNMLNTAS